MDVLWENSQLKASESVVYNERRNLFFVSNVNGGALDKNGKGFISALTLDGKISHLRWVEGLHAPKGLAVLGHHLYVVDIDQLLVINIDSGRIEKNYYVEDAVFLNDVAIAPQGDVYVSDMMTNTIYRLSSGKLDVWLHDEALDSPNGIIMQDENMIVASWGVVSDEISTNEAGHLKSISLESKEIKSLGSGQPIGHLDGVESNGKGQYYVTDWINGGLFEVNSDGEARKLLSLAQGSADLTVVLPKGLLLIPMMKDNKLLAYKIQ